MLFWEVTEDFLRKNGAKKDKRKPFRFPFGSAHQIPGLLRKPRFVCRGVSVKQIVAHELLQELVPVKLADEAACVVVIRDIGRVLREKIADDLVDGIVALLRQGAVDLGQDPLHFLGAFGRHGEFYGVVVQNVRLLYTFSLSYTN